MYCSLGRRVNVKRLVALQWTTQKGLLTVDLICHGVPSYKVLRDYIKWVEVKKKSKIQKISFRSSWGEEMILNDGKKNVWHRRMLVGSIFGGI